jgi:membrane-associated phospholipid phosphatase
MFATVAGNDGLRMSQQEEGRGSTAVPSRELKWIGRFLTVVAVILPSASVRAQVQDLNPGGQQQSSVTAPARTTQQPSDQTHLPDSPQAHTQDSMACGLDHPGRCLKDVGHDQAGIWRSPFHVRPRDAFWLAPFGAATGIAINYDAQAQRALGRDKTRVDISSALSNAGLFGSIATAGGLFLVGEARHDDTLAESGWLSGEAMIDSFVVAEAIKLATNRQRPNEGNGGGQFWPHGTRSYEFNGAFPSGHAIATFAFARVIASEYSGKWVKPAVYALALGVAAGRVTAREHFPSDVLVGGTLGYLVGGYVIHHHGRTGSTKTGK